MSEQELQDLITKLKDGEDVVKLLGCQRKRPSPSVNDLLFRGSPIAERLLSSLFEASFFDHTVVKKLLSSPSVYETPWKTSALLLQYIQKHDVTPDVTDIQSFLHQSVAYWWEVERKQTSANTFLKKKVLKPRTGESLVNCTPRTWILELVQIIKKCLMDKEQAKCRNRKTCLYLLKTIISLCGDLERPLLDSVLSSVFARNCLQSDCLVDWLDLAVETRTLLRERDWEIVQQTIRDELNLNGRCVLSGNVSGITRDIVTFGTFHIKNQVSGEQHGRSWCYLLLELLLSATKECDIYLKTESAMESVFMALSYRDIEAWFNVFLEDAPERQNPSEHDWVLASVLLVLERALSRSGTCMVSELVLQALGANVSSCTRQAGEHFHSRLWLRLRQLGSLGPSFLVAIPRTRSARIQSDSEYLLNNTRGILQHIFKNVSCDGKGVVSRKTSDGSRCEVELSKMSILVYKSVHIDHSGSFMEAYNRRSVDMVESWIDSVFSVVRSTTATLSVVDWIAAFAILLSLCTSRHDAQTKFLQLVINDCEQRGSGHADSETLLLMYSAILEVVFASTSESNTQNDLGKLASVVCNSRLPFLSFCDITLALARSGSARGLLLQYARTGLERKCTSSIVNLKTGEQVCMNVKRFIFVLIVLVDTSSWGEHEAQAWGILSDIILSNPLHLPLDVLSWLYSQLKSKNDFTNKRVLVVCLIKLLHFIENNELHAEKEDLSGLFDIIFSLLPPSDEKDACEFVSKWLGTIHEDETDLGTGFNNEACFLNEVDMFSIAMFCLLHFVHPKEGDKTKTINGLPFGRYFLEQLYKLERDAFPRLAGANFMPSWLGSSPKRSYLGLKWKSETERHEDFLSRWLLCDTLAGLLLPSDAVLSDEFDIVSDMDRRTTAMLLGNVFQQRRRLKLLAEAGGQECTRNSHQKRRMLRLFGRFLLITASTGALLLREGRHFHNADLVIHAVLDFCGFVSSCDCDLSGLDCGPSQLWELYLCLGSEDATLELLAFLEEHSKKSNNDRFCSMEIKTSDDIDLMLRHVRYSIVKAVSAVLSSHLMCVAGDSVKSGGLYSMSELESSLDFASTLIRLSDDLKLGLSGSSGGLTYDILDAYAICIDRYSQIIVACLPSMKSAECRRCAKASIKSSQSLKEILCTYSLNKASSFSRIFLLAWRTLPSAAQAGRLALLIAGNCKYRGTEKGHGDVSLFQDLVRILRRKRKSSGICDIPWTMIAGQEHLCGLICKSLGDNEDKQSASDGVTPVVQFSPELDASNKKIVLESEKAWSWAFGCIFLVYHNVWEGSHSLFEEESVIFASRKESILYSNERSVELSESLQMLCALLRRCQTPENEVESQLHIDATVLPPSTKAKLFYSLARVTDVLQSALKSILSHLNELAQLASPTADCVALNEMVCVVVAWLRLPADSELLSGITRWYVVECQLSSLENSNHCFYKAESKILRRFPTLLYRADEVFALSQKLCQALEKVDDKSKVLSNVNHILVANGFEMQERLFAKLLTEKVDTVRKQRSKLEGIFGHALKGSTKRGRSHASDSKTMRKRHQSLSLRSRNAVVDSWLQMDGQIGNDEAQSDDIYADLEDFLVDG